jgi:hypothetical protein
MKKWLSRGIVLAMVVALMVPMPVLAKSKSSKSGGKLVKSVMYYDYDNGKDGKYGTADDFYKPYERTSFKYDKKNNPTEIKWEDDFDLFLNVPVNGWSYTRTLKNKYKGKKLVSVKGYNQIGVVDYTATYKNGRIASFNRTSDLRTVDGVEQATKSSGSVAYNKAGNVTATCRVTMSSGYPESEYYDENGTWEYNDTFYVVQKSGIPSYIYNTGNYKYTDTKGNVKFVDYSVNGGPYASCNGKGLITQKGRYDAKDNKYNASYNVQYVMKKGSVSEAILFRVGEDGKEEAVGKYVFSYTKTKVSKQRYANMINSFIDDDSMGCFIWY